MRYRWCFYIFLGTHLNGAVLKSDLLNSFLTLTFKLDIYCSGIRCVKLSYPTHVQNERQLHKILVYVFK